MTQAELFMKPAATTTHAKSTNNGSDNGSRNRSNNGPNNGSSGKKPVKFQQLRHKLSKTKLRIPLCWIRHRGFRPTDVFLGSYPRSGSTWSRFILYELLTGREAGFDAVNTTLRGVHRLDRGIPTLPGEGRVLGSHEQYRREYKKAVFLVRDGRDVALSEYAFVRAQNFFHGDFDEFLLRFLGEGPRINGFGPWQEHVASWMDSPIAGTSNLLLVRYEDLRQSPEEWFGRMAAFFGVPVSRDTVRRALDNNSLNRMKEKERESPQFPSEKDSFVRSGSVQGWRGKLTPSQIELIEQYAGASLMRLGYPTVTCGENSVQEMAK
jgi:hypothetical protein